MTTIDEDMRIQYLIYYNGNYYIAYPGAVKRAMDTEYEDYTDNVADIGDKIPMLHWCEKNGAVICRSGEEMLSVQLDEDPRDLYRRLDLT